MRKAGKNSGNAEIQSRRHRLRTLAPAAVLCSLFFVPAFPLPAATVIRFSGSLSGLVLDKLGKPQPGALVSLLNQQERLLQRSYTDLAGNFSFGDLLPDLYMVQVSAASYVPATRDHLQVRPGMRSLLQVSLSKMFSSIQLVSTVPAPGGLMGDEWKWTLRADSSLRPIVRLLPSAARSPSVRNSGDSAKAAAFHDSQGLVRISTSEGALTAGSADEADLGTQFAFATSLYANNRVRVSGDLGYASTTGQPAAAIRTTYSRRVGAETPSVSVTMRQMNVPTRVGQGISGNPSGDAPLPTMRTLSVSLRDQTQLSESAWLQYGSEFDVISYLDRIQYFSPWARLSYALPHGRLDLDFSSGNARPNVDDLDGPDAGLRSELAALAMMPRMSERDGRVKVQRGDNYEIGYATEAGPIQVRVSGHMQHVADAALTIASPGQDLFVGDLLPSMFASSALFDAGSVSSAGYSVSATRRLGQNHDITVAYGTVGVLTLPGTPFSDAAGLRDAVTPEERSAFTVRSKGTVRHLGTKYNVSYQRSNLQGAMAMASFSTQPDRAEPGLNISIRQPIPVPGIPGRVEATAEMHNVLADGYLPVSMVDGRQLLIVNTPRVFRGGLAFVF